MVAQVRPLLVNGYEVLADREVGRAATASGYRVAPKPRLAEAFELDGSGLSSDLLGYALFAPTSTSSSPRATSSSRRFAVSSTDPATTILRSLRATRRRRRSATGPGLPLLRIDGTLLRRIQRTSLVGLLVEAWGPAKAS